ncbi:MAG: adenylate kinase [Candidatus Hermodarchaeota archaeon]
MKKVILFGPPGAGKGTFSSQIKEILPEIIHISTGDIFRENLKNETPLGLKAKTYMDKGELVPDDVTIEMVRDRLNKDDVKKNGFILDGFPRNISQAEALSKMTEIDKVILLNVPQDIIIKRILGRYSCPNCGEIYNKYFMKPKKEGICDKCSNNIEFKQRPDDTEETLKNRLEVYDKNTKPLIKYYKNQKLVKEIDYSNKLPEKKVKKVIGI